MIHSDLVFRVAMSRPDLPMERLWWLISRAQCSESLPWLGRFLWEWRVCSFMTSESVQEHCLACGARLPAGGGRQSYCAGSCRNRALRQRQSSEGASALEVEVRRCTVRLGELEQELESYGRWYRRNSSMQIMPPDLLLVEHLPKMPGRCGLGCFRGVGCSHTDGGPCLFAGTKGEANE